jgi:hypothetical protein
VFVRLLRQVRDVVLFRIVGDQPIE